MINFLNTNIYNLSEKDKLANLYNNYKDVMFAVALKILKNKYDAEDAVHQAFIKIANNLEKISEENCPKTKAFTVIIVRNTAIDIYNKNKKNFENTCDEETLNFVPINNDIFEQVEYSELIESIKKLPQNMKDVLYLHCVNGFSVDETAQLLSITPEAAYKRLQRARASLLKMLNGKG